MSLHAARSASDSIAALDDGWDLEEARPVASTAAAAPPRPAPAARLDDGWGLADENRQPAALQLVPAAAAEPAVIAEQSAAEPAVIAEPMTAEPAVIVEPMTAEPVAPPAYAAVAFSTDELAFFDAGEQLASTRPAPVETFDDVPEPPRRGFWQRLLSRDR